MNAPSSPHPPADPQKPVAHQNRLQGSVAEQEDTIMKMAPRILGRYMCSEGKNSNVLYTAVLNDLFEHTGLGNRLLCMAYGNENGGVKVLGVELSGNRIANIKGTHLLDAFLSDHLMNLNEDAPYPPSAKWSWHTIPNEDTSNWVDTVCSRVDLDVVKRRCRSDLDRQILQAATPTTSLQNQGEMIRKSPQEAQVFDQVKRHLDPVLEEYSITCTEQRLFFLAYCMKSLGVRCDLLSEEVSFLHAPFYQGATTVLALRLPSGDVVDNAGFQCFETLKAHRLARIAKEGVDVWVHDWNENRAFQAEAHMKLRAWDLSESFRCHIVQKTLNQIQAEQISEQTPPVELGPRKLLRL